MNDNVFFVCLNYDYAGKIANEIATVSDTFFLDVNNFIEYSLLDIERVKKLCGIEYLKKEQKKILHSIKDYERTLINLPYDFIINDEFSYLFNDCYVIYLELDKKELMQMNNTKRVDNNLNLELIVVDELNKLLKEKAKVILKLSGEFNKDINLVKEELNKLNIWGNI